MKDTKAVKDKIRRRRTNLKSLNINLESKKKRKETTKKKFMRRRRKGKQNIATFTETICTHS